MFEIKTKWMICWIDMKMKWYDAEDNVSFLGNSYSQPLAKALLNVFIGLEWQSDLGMGSFIVSVSSSEQIQHQRWNLTNHNMFYSYVWSSEARWKLFLVQIRSVACVGSQLSRESVLFSTPFPPPKFRLLPQHSHKNNKLFIALCFIINNSNIYYSNRIRP